MGKALVIVESPTKAKTINKYLGDNYIVKSSVGHIRDLLKSSLLVSQKKRNVTKKCQKVIKNKQELLVTSMGVDPYHGWKANYQILPGKEKLVSELKILAINSEHIYLATDLDREGEAIAWHLREVIGGDVQRFSRVVFNEITQKSITTAFDNPCELNIHRVQAQQARRFLDRVFGYMLSPLLWKKIGRGLSAGRVQSVAVGFVVKKEREIKQFVSKEYWKLHANIYFNNTELLPMKVVNKKGKIFKPEKKIEIDNAILLLKNTDYQVLECKEKNTFSKPNPPFITSTLQQVASTRLNFSVKKTMMMAQMLYEAGYITYMRTDSTNLSLDAINMVRDYIHDKFGKEYLSEKINVYMNTKSSQEAHEAIRPSNIHVNAEDLKDLEPDSKKLYQLIWNQFVACQMKSAKFSLKILTVTAGDFLLQAKSRFLNFDGWMKVMPLLDKNNVEKILQNISVTAKLKLKELFFSQHFTKPPARFTETSLIKELEKRGIGRPSTYPIIISNIQDRGYVRIKQRRFYAEKIGEIVTDRLNENFKELMDCDFTAKMENQLDLIATGRIEWKSVLDAFFSSFVQQLEIANQSPEEGGMRLNPMVLTSILCPHCNRKMGIKNAATGVFLGCSGYQFSLSGYCRYTINLIPEDELSTFLTTSVEDVETDALRARHRCIKCSTAMDSYFIDNKSKLYICGNNPTCNGYKITKGDFSIKGYNDTIISCDKCNSEMYLKIGKFGKYMRCVNGNCKNIRKVLINGEISPPKELPIPLPELICKKTNTYFVLKDGSAGIFLAASNFPKSKETRTPLVEELIRFKKRLPSKFIYLTKAPILDPEGNKTIIKFNRKTKEQYITSEKNGKSTGWSAIYINNQWVANSE
ncbi:type I DNA topoisomerase [Arsenophonus symbiont of Ornithomya chloropus]|uniref:type I DNA topoisomerase n=1 Tax=Arsenophonus symbiont of Ornithomya chloropus TaxID=634121 RepID=UPI0032B113BF